MARKKLSEGKKNIIAGLIEEYNIQTAEDIQEALKDLLGGTIQEMLEAELDGHLGYASYERSSNPDYRNGTKPKKLKSTYGEIPIDVPQDRNGDFEPKIVPKRKKDISEIEQKIISLYAKGLSTRQISSVVNDIYGFEVSDGMISDITDKIMPQIEEWQNRPLSEIYPIVFIDCIHFSVRDEHISISDFFIGVMVYCFKVIRKGFLVLFSYPLKRIPYLMNNTTLIFRCRKSRCY